MANNYPSYFMCLIQITQFVLWKGTYMSHFRKLRAYSAIIGNYFSVVRVCLVIWRFTGLIDGRRKWKREGCLLLFCLVTHVGIAALSLVYHHTDFANIRVYYQWCRLFTFDILPVIFCLLSFLLIFDIL